MYICHIKRLDKAYYCCLQREWQFLRRCRPIGVLGSPKGRKSVQQASLRQHYKRQARLRRYKRIGEHLPTSQPSTQGGDWTLRVCRFFSLGCRSANIQQFFVAHDVVANHRTAAPTFEQNLQEN